METILLTKIKLIKRFIKEKRDKRIVQILKDLHAADIAEIIEVLKVEKRLYIFNLLKREVQSEVISELEEATRESLVPKLDQDVIVDLIEALDSDEAVDLFQDLTEERQEEVLENIDEEVAEEVHELMSYAEDTAGGIMRLEFIQVNETETVANTRKIIKHETEEEDLHDFYNIWISDDKGILRGFVSLQDLIIAAPEQLIKDVMTEEIIFVHPEIDQEEVANLSVKYNLVSVPVVDQQKHLLGVITFDDIGDIMDEEADEDIAKFSGSGDLQISEESPFRISKARLPWLLISLFGELISAYVIYQFQGDLQKAIALSFFFPVIMAMGGNIGIQASAIVVRGLATGEISGLNLRRRLFRELKSAFITGIICGLIIFIIVSLWFSINKGAMVSVALLVVILNAATVGATIPFILQRMNIDPAISTGPFITTSNDIFGLLIYLAIVTTFM